MTKYVFKNRQISFEEGVYVPITQKENNHQKGVVLIPLLLHRKENELAKAGRDNHDD